MAINILNDRIELSSIFANTSSIGDQEQSYSDAFYSDNSALTFTLSSSFIDKPVLTDTTNNKIFVEGINQQTYKRYIVQYNSNESTIYGSDWDEGYYKIYIRQYVYPSNGSDIASGIQNCKYYNLNKENLYWNKSILSFMTYIQPGTFWMGSPENEIGRVANHERMHHVTFSNAFYIARTPMTNNLCHKLLSGSSFGPANEYYNLGTGSAEQTTFVSGASTLNTCFASGNTPAWSNMNILNNNSTLNITYAKYNRIPSSTLTGTRGGGNSINGFIKSNNIGYPPPYITGSYMGAETDRSLLHAMEIKIPFTHSNGTVYHWDLPTHAQWEYACRAGTTTAFNNGENLKFEGDVAQPNINEICWYKQHNNSNHPVAMLKPNQWGLFDCHGLLSEWCKDWYVNNNLTFTNGDIENLDYPASVISHVVKSSYYSSPGYNNRSAFFGGNNPSTAASIGFRPVLHI